MLTLTFSTKEEPEVVRARLADAFGPEGLGLGGDTVGETTAYTGGGGYITAIIRRAYGETVVDIRTEEFEDDVRRFARQAA